MMSGPHSEVLNKDPKTTKSYFQTLVHFAPHVATEPLAAGSFTRKLLEYNELKADDLRNLTSVEDSMLSARGAYGDPLSKGLAAAGIVPHTMTGIGYATGLKT